MLHQFGQLLTNAWANLRVADVVDVALVSVVLYVVISWVRRRASVAAAVGLGLGVGAYAAAEIFSLYLTSFVFKVGLTVMLFGFLLVFQDDIRRLLEHIRIRATGGADRDKGAGNLDVVVEACSKMADARTGALIVLKGEESIDIHTHGGIALGGEVTVPLLLSLFQPNSPAHDGAVVLEDGRVEKFGVHLPLSTDDAQLGEGGTRHAAALGLAERCDATVVVVSEERGTVSVAREGRLEELSGASELNGRLGEGRSAADAASAGRWTWWRGALRENLALKGASVLMAGMLWLTFASRTSTFQRTFDFPVEYRNVPENLAVETRKPFRARVQLRGPRRAFEQLERGDVALALDLTDARPGRRTMVLSGDQLELPAELSVATIEPSRVTVHLFEMVSTSLPVSVATKGRPPEGVTVAELGVKPESVPVRIRKSHAGRIQQVATQPVDLSGIRETTTVKVSLTPDPKVRWRKDFNGTVEVTVHVDTEPSTSGDSGL